uniref:Pentatricopeptide repeat-containing protein n=1 Tax=Romanomermis culicivorax TaxID=13658 RepID=A0A915J6V4_ROMCU
MAKVLSLRPRSLSLLQSKCPKRSGGAILVDRSKHRWTFSSLAILTEEISDTASVSKALSVMRRNLIESSNDLEEVLEIFDTIDILSEKTQHKEKVTTS